MVIRIGICATLDAEMPANSFNYELMTMNLTDGSVAYYEAGWGSSIAADNLREFMEHLLEMIEHDVLAIKDVLISYKTATNADQKGRN